MRGLSVLFPTIPVNDTRIQSHLSQKSRVPHRCLALACWARSPAPKASAGPTPSEAPPHPLPHRKPLRPQVPAWAGFLPAPGSYGLFSSISHNCVFSLNCHNEIKSVTLLCLSLLFKRGHWVSFYTEKPEHVKRTLLCGRGQWDAPCLLTDPSEQRSWGSREPPPCPCLDRWPPTHLPRVGAGAAHHSVRVPRPGSPCLTEDRLSGGTPRLLLPYLADDRWAPGNHQPAT